MNPLLFLGRVQWIYPFNRNAISLFYLVHQIVGFGKQKLGVQRKEAKVPAHSGSNVDQGHALGTESRRDRDCLPESVERPGEDPLRFPGFGRDLQFSNFLFHDFFLHATGSSSGLNPAATLCESAASNPCSNAGKVTACSTNERSANFTTSPTTRSVGDASRGALPRSETVER